MGPLLLPRRQLTADRIAVFGDLSGHAVPWLRELSKLGVVFDQPQLPRQIVAWPDDLVTVQVGDLVHKGSDSDLAVAVVSELLLPTGRHVQLAGNHEGQYLGGATFWDPPVSSRCVQELQQLWQAGQMVAAAAVVHPDGVQTLVSHAGAAVSVHQTLTRRAARQLDAVTVAGLLADPANDELVATPGMMRGNDYAVPGVMWTGAHRELHRPWVDRDAAAGAVPYDQVHGHSAPLLYGPRGRMRVPADLAATTTHDRKLRHVTTVLPVSGRRIVAIDPGATSRTPTAPRPLLLRGTVHW